jgi:hypothetical protein
MLQRLQKAPLPALGLIAIAGFLSLNFIPQPQTFEGTLETHKFSFISSSPSPEPQGFLSVNADQITLSRALDSEPFPFQLPLQLGGTIQSRDQPSLNNRQSLSLKLTDSDELTIAAPQANPLFFRLKLPTTVQVRSLSYNPGDQQLSFSLRPQTQAVPTLDCPRRASTNYPL